MLPRLIIATVLVSGCLTAGTMVQATADEATTTTTTTTTEHHEEGLGAVITAPARAAGAAVDAVVGGGSGGCSHKTVTKTDGETGDSVTKSRTDCD